MAKPLAIEDRDGVAVARMEFGKGNALGPAVLEELAAGIDRTAGRPLVLTGSGKIFSAGLDLVALGDLDRSGMEAFVERFSTVFMTLLTARRPVVAAVNGHAVAGGCVLALTCDHRVAVDADVKIGMNELAIGLSLPAVVTEILREVLTHRTFRRVVLHGEMMSPSGALELGVVDELQPDTGAAVERACEVARELGASPKAFAVMKGSVVSPIAARLQETRTPLDRAFLDSWFAEPSRRARAEVVARLEAQRS